MTNDNPAEGDLRVWYIPQIPGKPYEVDIPRRAGASDAAYLQQAAFVIEAIIGLSIFEFENRIKPDYADMSGIARFEDGEWCDVEEDEYADLASI
jgi:hypothetical protein